MKEHTIDVVFETSNYQEAQTEEARLISLHDTTNPEKGYNRRFGGSKYGFPDYVDHSNKVTKRGKMNGMFGKKHSLETREKIRQKTLARHPSTFESSRKKTREQLEKLHKGRDAYLKENPHPMEGKTHTLEAREKISAAMKRRHKIFGR